MPDYTTYTTTGSATLADYTTYTTTGSATLADSIYEISATVLRVAPELNYVQFGTHRPRIRRPSPEQLEELEQLERKREEAKIRAEQLLRRYLSAAQQETLNRDKYFDVRSQHGRMYRLRVQGDYIGNISVLNERGVPERGLCCHLDDSVPLHDHILAQKLMLEANEHEFLRLANPY